MNFDKNRMAIGIWISCLIIGLALILLTIMQTPLRVDTDVAAYLNFGTRIAEGQVPFVDFFDPYPIPSYINILPAWLSQITNLHPLTALQVVILILIGVSSGLMIYLQWPLLHHQRGFVFIAPLALIGVSIWTLLGPLQFGQREHLFVILFAPALLVRWRRWEAVPVHPILAFIMGMVGALAVLIKPQFVIVFVLVEVYALVRYRQWRNLFVIETVGFGLIANTVVLLFLSLSPETMGHIIGISDGYYDSNRPFSYYFTFGRVQQCLVIYAAFVIVRFLPMGKQNQQILRLGELWIALSIGGFLTMAVQGKGIFWFYHWLIQLGGAVIVAGILLWIITNKLLKNRHEIWLATTCLIIALPIALINLNTISQLTPSSPSHVQEVIYHYSQPQEAVLMLTHDMFAIYPTIQQTQRQLVNQFFVTYPVLPGYDEQSDITNFYWDNTRTTISQQRPRLVILDGFTQRALREQGITEELLAPHYALAEVMPFDIFYVYVGDLPQHETTYRFGDAIDLLTWQHSDPTTLQRCDTFDLTTVWGGTPSQNQDEAYSLSLVLAGDAGGITQVDGTPSQVETYNWEADERYADRRQLTIPCDLPAGTYSILLTLYQPEIPNSNAFIQTSHQEPVGNHLWLGSIQID